MKNLLLIIVLFSHTIIYAQVLTHENDDKKTSIVYPGGSFDINIVDEKFEAGYLGYVPIKKASYFSKLLLGFQGLGETKNKVLNLYKEGEVANKSQFSGYIGFEVLPKKTGKAHIYQKLIEHKQDSAKLDKNQDAKLLYNGINKRLTKLISKLDKEVENSKKEDLKLKDRYYHAIDQQDKLVRNYKDGKEDEDFTYFTDDLKVFISNLEAMAKATAEDSTKRAKDLNLKYPEVSKIYREEWKKHKERTEKTELRAIKRRIEINRLRDEAFQLEKAKSNISLVVFARGGMRASKFTITDGITDLDSFQNNFTSKKFTGFSRGLGINLTYKQFIFGASYDYRRSNNLALLTPSDYSFERKETNPKETLTFKKDYAAYDNSKYKEFNESVWSIDALGFFKLSKKEDEKGYIVPNLYLRHVIGEDANVTTIGLSGLFFKDGKSFAGGFYFEIPDISNNVTDANAVSIEDRVAFGIIGKYTFGSILGPNKLP